MERFPCRLPIIAIACVLWTFLNLTPLCRAFEDVMRNPSKNLYQELSDTYGSPALRPVVNLSQPIVVHHRLLVSQIIDFDEPQQTLTLSSWQRMVSYDHLLTFLFEMQSIY
nr:neuronal acetylcholine receptor subunit alpha-3-like [Lytechinus pictus]